jgi:hypothetical protein
MDLRFERLRAFLAGRANGNKDEFSGWLATVPSTRIGKFCLLCLEVLFIFLMLMVALREAGLIGPVVLPKALWQNTKLLALESYILQFCIIGILLFPLVKLNQRYSVRLKCGTGEYGATSDAAEWLQSARAPRSIKRAAEFLRWWLHAWVAYLLLYTVFIAASVTGSYYFQVHLAATVKPTLPGFEPAFQVKNASKFLTGLSKLDERPTTSSGGGNPLDRVFSDEQLQVFRLYKEKTHQSLQQFNYTFENGNRPIDLEGNLTVQRDLQELAETPDIFAPRKTKASWQQMGYVMNSFRNFIYFQPTLLARIVLDAINNAISIYLIYCVLALLPPKKKNAPDVSAEGSRRMKQADTPYWTGDPNVAMYWFVALFLAQIAFIFGFGAVGDLETREYLQQIAEWFSGILGAVCLIALCARLESRWLGIPLGAVAILYGYGAIQPAFAGFEQYPFFAVVFPLLAMVGKVLLFLVVYWLLERDVLLFYLAKSGRGGSEVDLLRENWLRKFREGQPIEESEIAEPVWLSGRLKADFLGINRLLTEERRAELARYDPSMVELEKLRGFLSELVNELCNCGYHLNDPSKRKVSPGDTAYELLVATNREFLAQQFSREIKLSSLEHEPETERRRDTALQRAAHALTEVLKVEETVPALGSEPLVGP